MIVEIYSTASFPFIQHYFLYTGNAECDKPISSNQVALKNKNAENEKCSAT